MSKIGKLQVGSAVALPGSKAEGTIDVSRRHDGTVIGVPVVVVNGAYEGPTFVTMAAVHGCEYPGIVATWRFLETLDPKVLRGQVISVPVANGEAFKVDSRVNDIDHKDMNRIFPGSPDGTLTERTAHLLTTEVIAKADCLVDLHCAGVGDISPVAIARRGMEELTVELAKASGVEFIWMGGVLGEGKGVQASAIALRRGVQATTLEAGGGRELRQESIDALYNALINILKYLKMIDGQPKPPCRRVYYTADRWPQVGVGGFFWPHVAAGQRVRAGELIYTIHDVYGHEMERLEAPVDGIISLITKKSSVRPGDYGCIFGEIVDEEVLE